MLVVEGDMNFSQLFLWLRQALRIFAQVFGPYTLETETVLVSTWFVLYHRLETPMACTLYLSTSSFVAKLSLGRHVLLRRFASIPWWSYKSMDFSTHKDGQWYRAWVVVCHKLFWRGFSRWWDLLTIEAKLGNIEHWTQFLCCASIKWLKNSSSILLNLSVFSSISEL